VGDWREYCEQESGLSIEGNSVTVVFPDERRHSVRVEDREESFELTSIVVKAATFQDIDDGQLRAWRRNRVSQLVGFRVDERGRLVGEAWVPKAGLRREEFLLYVRKVAAQCDEFEYQLTGRDVE